MAPVSVSQVLSDVNIVEMILLRLRRWHRTRTIFAARGFEAAYRRRTIEGCKRLSSCWQEQREAVQLVCLVHCDCLRDPFDVDIVAAVWRKGMLSPSQRHAYLRYLGGVTRIPGFGPPHRRRWEFSSMMREIAAAMGANTHKLGHFHACESSEVWPVEPPENQPWSLRRKATPSKGLVEFVETHLRKDILYALAIDEYDRSCDNYDGIVHGEFVEGEAAETTLSLFPWFDFTDNVKNVVKGLLEDEETRGAYLKHTLEVDLDDY